MDQDFFKYVAVTFLIMAAALFLNRFLNFCV